MQSESVASPSPSILMKSNSILSKSRVKESPKVAKKIKFKQTSIENKSIQFKPADDEISCKECDAVVIESKVVKKKLTSSNSKNNLTLAQKIKILKNKNFKRIQDKIKYKQLIVSAGGEKSMAVGILSKTFKFLAMLVKNSPKNSIRLNIPETLICTLEQTINFIFTNDLGFLEIEPLNCQCLS